MSATRLRLGADRRVIGVVPGALLGDPPTPRLGVLLDGTMIGTIALESGEGAGDWRLTLPLPGHRLAHFLDLLRLDSGESVLAAPFPLAPFYRLRWHGLAYRERRVDGAFSLAVALDPALYVTLTGGGATYARGFATRDAAGIYRFSLPIQRLVPLGPPIPLGLAVAGAPPSAEIILGASDLGVAGYVEGVEAGVVRGWVADLAATGRPLVVILAEDGVEIARALADEPRPDLASVGIGVGRAGFRLPYRARALAPPGAMPGAMPRALRITLAESGLALVGSPLAAPSLAGFAGYFDGIENGVALGWAVNLADPKQPLTIEIVQDGRVIAAGRADLPRPDVAAAGFPGEAAGFRLPLPLNQAALRQSPFFARLAAADAVLDGSPREARPNPAIAAFLTAQATPLPAARAARFKAARARRLAGLMLSLVMPVFNPRLAWLEEALASVFAQRADAFELICVDDGSTDPAIAAALRVAAADPRVRVLSAPKNEGFARALARGIAAAQGSHIAFLDHDDALAPDAVFQLLQAGRESGADLVFADAAFAAETLDEIEEVALGGAFSHDAFLARAALPRPLAIARRLAATLAPPDPALLGAEEFDFVLRAIAGAKTIAHLPRVLYLARRHGLGRAAILDGARVMAARKRAITRHLAALGLPARVRAGLTEGQCRLDWPAPKAALVAVIGDCATGRGEALRAALAALSVDIAAHPPPGPGPEFLLFLDEDIALPEGGAWLAHLLSLAARPDVGAAVPLLLTPSGQVREMGLVISADGVVLPALARDEGFLPSQSGRVRNPGPGGRLTLVRDVAAASRAALLLRRDVFAALGGFSPAFGPLEAAALTLSLRAGGLRVLASGIHPLVHQGGAAPAIPPALAARFRAHLGALGVADDPFYSPLCRQSRADFALADDPACRAKIAPRLVAAPAARASAILRRA